MDTRPEFPHLWVDFNNLTAQPDCWIPIPDIIASECAAVMEDGRRVILEETSSTVIDGQRHFLGSSTIPDYESIEVEAVLHPDGRFGSGWIAEPDWSTILYVIYPYIEMPYSELPDLRRTISNRAVDLSEP